MPRFYFDESYTARRARIYRAISLTAEAARREGLQVVKILSRDRLETLTCRPYARDFGRAPQTSLQVSLFYAIARGGRDQMTYGKRQPPATAASIGEAPPPASR